MRRPVREGHKPNGGRARAGEVGLCRSTCEPTEQGKATSCGGRGGKGAAGGEHRSTAHAPDSEQESACPRVWTVRVKQASVAGLLSRHSSFRRAVCVDAHVRICAGGAQRWASLPRHFHGAKPCLPIRDLANFRIADQPGIGRVSHPSAFITNNRLFLLQFSRFKM
jgi:hypothetical protein